jgi:D-alanyl-D-alanine carboxypeptidase
VAAAQRGGRRLGVVLLHSPDPGRQARVLLNRGFKVGR